MGGEGAGQGGIQRRAGEESRAFHAELDEWEEGAQLVVRLSLLPSELGSLLEEAQALGALAKETRVSAHVGAGVLRVAVRSVPGGGGGVEPWVGALQELRGRLEEKGGSLTISQAPLAILDDVGPWGAPGPEAPILEGLKTELDPRGILAPGRFVV